ncbi:ATP-binding cassette domain-containing protein [Leptospira gomenensis]|uniref:ATP-binding cassette domain-containing protein n=1 Tax=Leptospira gomenensis TaxID=2484974 RepID=A0A5F1Y8C0_9LEPT|nr:ATP-binding cassette domain-containing protein [Leptospira gomenensis]TGK31499.1 ATP-binding cassette domain-containing protein [Leptospira gomenensis]TGK32489.1 ATP-binding cassette domain-containing protein [Leptospira gomenensis]TGK46204.1 ATP-binding cassette domain-containing protein [Leptospira gomenensis]TGK54729.1 ATP-binding cassette domain-containing protein [Leptospira gomenensis]
MIQVENLRKKFLISKRSPGLRGAVLSLFHSRKEAIPAVDDISFSLPPGEFVGYIGPNGAGKSTTIKLLTGVLTPDQGKISVFGLDPSRDRKENSKQIGVVFGQKTQLWWDLPVGESFDLLKSVYRISEKDYKNRMELFFDLLGFEDFFHQQVRKLSLGQRMKAEIAASLLHFPRVLFLDEPTIGLDVLVKERVREFIRTINREEKVTVLLTTHDVQDIETLAKRIILIDHGKIRFDGGLDSFRNLGGTDHFVEVLYRGDSVPDLPSDYTPIFNGATDRFRVRVKEGESLNRLMGTLGASGSEILEVRYHKNDLAQVIRTLYKDRT